MRSLGSQFFSILLHSMQQAYARYFFGTLEYIIRAILPKKKLEFLPVLIKLCKQ
jgi:hypothetical protein